MKASQTFAPESETQQHTERLLNEYQAAAWLNMSVASMRRYRLLRKGPKFFKLGAAVRYRPEDLATWIEARPTGGEQTEA